MPNLSIQNEISVAEVPWMKGGKARAAKLSPEERKEITGGGGEMEGSGLTAFIVFRPHLW